MGLRARVALRRDRERPAFILMNADHWQTVNELFHEALARTGDARRAFLTEVDGRDPGSLRRQHVSGPYVLPCST